MQSINYFLDFFVDYVFVDLFFASIIVDPFDVVRQCRAQKHVHDSSFRI